jgi:mannan endo-1,4-beta-mannosidase
MTPGSSDQSPVFAPRTGTVRASKLNIALLLLALFSVGGALYLSPVSSGSPARTPSAGSTPGRVSGAEGGSTAPPTSVPSPTTTGTAGATPTPTPHPTGTNGSDSSTSSLFLSRALLHSQSSGTAVAAANSATPRSTPTRTRTAKTKCWQFTWQQDAQVVYVANLSDPYGLDGKAGPGDGDGLACSDLPVDPARPASTPTGAYVAPTPSPATKADLVNPSKDYFGFNQDGLPGDTAMFDKLATEAGKAPSSVGWFSSFDQTYRGDLVTQSWRRGALPVVTWMPLQSGSGQSYSLSSIAAGKHDAYLRRFAGDVTRTNLPIVLRFGHEMNGNWYGWSSGRTEWNNSPEKYIAAWRHIWQVFDEVGANDDVIWLWSISRVDNLHPAPANRNTIASASYPGDQYVDWVGASVYLRKAATGPSFDASFGQTVTALRSVTTKPIFFPEIGAVESDNGDQAALKAAWIHNTLTTFAGDSRFVGFLWFNNVAGAVVDGETVSNDWRFTSSAAAKAQFRTGISSSRYASGTPLDSP